MSGIRYITKDVTNKAEQSGWSLPRDFKHKSVKDRVLATCKVCGYVKDVTVETIMYGFSCKECNKQLMSEYYRKPFEVVIKELKEVHPFIKVLSQEYINAHSPLDVMCLKCGRVWVSCFNYLYAGSNGCLDCSIKENAEKQRTPIDVIFSEMEELSNILNFEWINKNQYTNTHSDLVVECKKCKYKRTTNLFTLRKLHRCPKCVAREKASQPEKYIQQYIKDRYPNLNMNTNDRTVIINPYTKRYLELDIYLPEINLAIEFNGTYWHSDEVMIYTRGIHSINHRELKTSLCEAKGIKLLHIEEEDYNNNWKSVSSRIRGSINYRINSLSHCNSEITFTIRT